MKPKNSIATFLLVLLSLSTQNLSAAESIEYSDEAGQKLLLCAKRGNKNGVKEILAEKQANINIQDKAGNTAIHLTTITKKGYYDIISILLKNGANPNIQNQDGNNPLDLAVEKKHAESVNILEAAVNTDIKPAKK